MKMSKTKKGVMGVATLLAMSCFVLFGVIVNLRSSVSEEDPLNIVLIIVPILMLLYYFIMMGMYCTFIYSTNRIPKDSKIIWILFTLIFHLIAMPIIWFVHVRKEPNPEA